MVEIRIHGRGGQGSVVLAELLAVAAWQEGKYSQAFPYLGGGGERRGAPVQAFARMSDRPIRLRCRVQNPDYVLVQDPALVDLVDVTRGVKPGGLILVNGEEVPARLAQATSFRVRVVPVTRLALEAAGKPLTNTAMLGVFAAGTGELSLASALAAVQERFPGQVGEVNARAVEAGYRAAAATGAAAETASRAAGNGGGCGCCCGCRDTKEVGGKR